MEIKKCDNSKCGGVVVVNFVFFSDILCIYRSNVL